MLFNDPGTVLMMQMAIMEIIHVIPMLYRGMPTVGAMHMVMVFVIVSHLFLVPLLRVNDYQSKNLFTLSMRLKNSGCSRVQRPAAQP